MSGNLDEDISGLEALIQAISITEDVPGVVNDTIDGPADDETNAPVDQNGDTGNEVVELMAPNLPDHSLAYNHTLTQALITSEIVVTDENILEALPRINEVVKTVSPELLPPALVVVAHNVTMEVSKKKKIKENDAITANMAPEESSETNAPHTACARCARQPSPDPQDTPITLKTCSKCLSVEYCSEKCQADDWDSHKTIYCVDPRVIPIKMLSKPLKGRILRTHIVNPFGRLAKGIWLHDRHKLDVYALLIDSFRVRESDNYFYGRMLNYQSVYNGKDSSSPPFHRFLDVAETKGVLPHWWSDEKRVECLELGLDRSFYNFHDLYAMTRDVEILVAYGDTMILMQMRMFAEAVYGDGPAGTDGRLLKQKMAMMEVKARDACK